MKTWSTLTIDNASRTSVNSRTNGVNYDVRVWVPPDAMEQQLPVLYVLDGAAIFGTVTESVQRLSRRSEATNVRPAIVVAVDRTGSDAERTAQRQLDYTPGPPAEEPGKIDHAGGADDFLSFLADELIPLIENQFPAASSERVLVGHSLAGYFSLLSLVTRPELFRTCIAISPSIWWDSDYLRQRVERLREFGSRVMIATGEWESGLAPWQQGHATSNNTAERRSRRGMSERAEQFARDLAAVIGKDNVRNYLFPGEDHASILLVGIARALQFAVPVHEAG